MWVVCYSDDKGRNVWVKIADDGDLYTFLYDESFMDEHGERLTDDIMIFREKSEVEDLDHLFHKLHRDWVRGDF